MDSGHVAQLVITHVAHVAHHLTLFLQFKWMKIDYEAGGEAPGFNLAHVMQQLQGQLDAIPPPAPGSRATHALITG